MLMAENTFERQAMKQILLIATGGTIASKSTHSGLSPKISPEELLTYVPEAEKLCEIEVIQPFNLDSTNVRQEHWLQLEKVIEENYSRFDGFVICHGTDTMAYTSAALSYLIQNNRKPIVVTGAQRPIDLAITDARANLLDSIRFACDDRAHGVNIVFGGTAIAGTRAKKERTKSFNAFSSINYPAIAIIQDQRIVFYIDDKELLTDPEKFYREMDARVFLLKLIPGSDGKVLEHLLDVYDAVIIESFGVGGIPTYGDDYFQEQIRRFVDAGKMIVMATQVTHEGSDMSVYRVGQIVKNTYRLPESYDMTLESTIAKTMWILGQTRDPEQFRELFYQTINHDMLFSPMDGETIE